MIENEKKAFLARSKQVVNDFRALLNDVEKHLDSKDAIQQGIGANYALVIDECFNNFNAKLEERFDELEKKGIVKRRE